MDNMFFGDKKSARQNPTVSRHGLLVKSRGDAIGENREGPGRESNQRRRPLTWRCLDSLRNPTQQQPLL